MVAIFAARIVSSEMFAIFTAQIVDSEMDAIFVARIISSEMGATFAARIISSEMFAMFVAQIVGSEMGAIFVAQIIASFCIVSVLFALLKIILQGKSSCILWNGPSSQACEAMFLPSLAWSKLVLDWCVQEL